MSECCYRCGNANDFECAEEHVVRFGHDFVEETVVECRCGAGLIRMPSVVLCAMCEKVIADCKCKM